MVGFRLFSSIFLFAGLAMLGGSFFLYRSTNTFIHEATKADGKVVAMHTSYSRSKNGGSSRTYSPVVQFYTPTNEPLRFTSDFSTSPPAYRIGQKVTVLHSKNNPEDAKISDFWSLWFGTVFLIGMGTIFTAVGAGLTFARMPNINRPNRNAVPNGAAVPVPPSYEVR